MFTLYRGFQQSPLSARYYQGGKIRAPPKVLVWRLGPPPLVGVPEGKREECVAADGLS